MVFGLLVFSFPIGAYLFFNSDIGKNIDYQYPISEIDFIKKLDLGWASSIEIGDLFIAVWLFFLVLFVIAIFGPNRNFVRVLSPIMAGTPDRQDGNYLVHTIKWFTIIIILSQAIDVIQQQFGVVITPPPIENDLMQLLMVSLAPIVEEIGFRVILVGIPIFLLYSHRASVRYFFRSLWNPSSVLPAANPKKAIIVIAMSAILFGMAHVMSDQGWTSGKIAQAAMSGMIIGWVYYRYGFVSAILIHWATNYVIFSYGYLVSSVNDVGIMDAFSHSLLQTIEVLFVVTGALSLAMIWLNSRKTLHVQG